ncbi:hypothetical protein T08_1930 [Trichinella sp. T8]|nr:hypothetical protein T08_1930 [Trichinella sp. T8]
MVYLDDIIIFGKTEEEHLERLEKVLSRLQSVGLKIKPAKCQLMRRVPGPRCDAAWGWYRSRENGGGPGEAHASVPEGSPGVSGTGVLLQEVCQEFRRRGESIASPDKER